MLVLRRGHYCCGTEFIRSVTPSGNTDSLWTERELRDYRRKWREKMPPQEVRQYRSVAYMKWEDGHPDGTILSGLKVVSTVWENPSKLRRTLKEHGMVSLHPGGQPLVLRKQRAVQDNLGRYAISAVCPGVLTTWTVPLLSRELKASPRAAYDDASHDVPRASEKLRRLQTESKIADRWRAYHDWGFGPKWCYRACHTNSSSRPVYPDQRPLLWRPRVGSGLQPFQMEADNSHFFDLLNRALEYFVGTVHGREITYLRSYAENGQPYWGAWDTTHRSRIQCVHGLSFTSLANVSHSVHRTLPKFWHPDAPLHQE